MITKQVPVCKTAPRTADITLSANPKMLFSLALVAEKLGVYRFKE
jgi:hypothetical protein